MKRMNTCPHCGQSLQEGAHFCPYCMTSLDEKAVIPTAQPHTRRLLTVSVVLLLALAIIAPALWQPPVITTENGLVTTTTSGTASTSVSSPTSSFSGGTQGSGLSSTTTPSSSQSINQIVSGEQPTSLSDNDRGTTTANSAIQTPAAVSYTYRDAKHGDDFSVSTDLSNCVVITGIQTKSENGEYRIPATINGKTVIAIMPLAFSDSAVCHTVKTVVVPKTVKTIWNDAFAGCDQLSDVYFCGNAIYTESKAFESQRNSTLVIHCSASCHDRNFRYYKSSAVNYGAVYQEWNG